MRCPACRGPMRADPACESFDEHMILTVTEWRCGGCGEVVEEVAADPMGEGHAARRLRYVVREWQPPARKRRPFARAAMGTPRYAAA